MYPIFFIPPYNNGEKYRTILGQTPKTHILSANMYELEILRLLRLFTFEDEEEHITDHWALEEIEGMTEVTIERLKTTCFGANDDGVGECFDASLIVLRYLASVYRVDRDWIYSRIDNFYNHAEDKQRAPQAEWYFWLCLSELPESIAKREINRYRGKMQDILSEGLPMKTESDRIYSPVKMAILKNTLSHLPEFEYIKNRTSCIDEQNGRLVIDMEK